MKKLLDRYRSFDQPVRFLMVNQLSINLGFYMLMPYLAAHLAGDLGLAASVVGVVLGVRNLSQQGMFLVGGSLADRFGYKPMIVAGCLLRVAGFALLGVVDSVPALVVASAATGFAGALFNPAVRAYLAQDAGERRVEAFALFNVFYQAGILLGPLVGLVLTGIDFQLTCLVAAAVFAALSLLQIRALPARHGQVHETADDRPSVFTHWRTVTRNRRFLAFSAAMIGSYVLSFQVYLALPLEIRRLAPTELAGTVAVGILFAVSGVVAVTGQLGIVEACKRRWNPGQCLTAGLVLIGAGFAPPLLVAGGSQEPGASLAQQVVVLSPLVASAVVLTLGTIVVYPFEMDTIVSLSGDRLVATHYGLYSTICGIGITAGNFLTGAALDLARSNEMPALPWLGLVTLGLGCAAAVHALHRTGRLVARSRGLPIEPIYDTL